MQSYRQCLVLGCGADCKNHPAERWFSIDSAEDKKPDLCKPPNEITPEDFEKNSNRNKFKVIFLENLTPQKTPAMSQLKELLADNASLIFYGSQFSWQDFLKANFKIQSFISYQNKTVLVMTGASFKTTLELLRMDLTETGCDKSFLKFMNLMEKEFNRLNGEKRPNNEKRFPPLMAAVLAHLSTYVLLRKERPIRNYFKDNDYEKLLPAMEELMDGFVQGQKSLEEARLTLKKWKNLLPSSMLPSDKLDYTPLEQLLELGYEAMTYHAYINKAENKVERQQVITKRA